MNGKAKYPKEKIGDCYPGLASTAKFVGNYVPTAKIYVEPFAGLGRLCRFIQCETIVLNDKSTYAVNHLRKHFRHHIVTQVDFIDCIKAWDSSETFFFIDPPWYDDIYKYNEKTFCDRTDEEYYIQLLGLLPTLRGNWILCSGACKRYAGFNLLEKTDYYKMTIENPDVAIFGKSPKVLIVSNKPFISKQTKLLLEESIKTE